MADVVSPAKRSQMMSGIRGKNTRPEIILRKGIHSRGLRFRLHRSELPGKPDLVFPRFNVVYFVHGCFWHRHKGCRFCATPSTRADFWASKFQSNVSRDARNIELLLQSNWRVAIVWECQLRKGSAEITMDQLANWIRDTNQFGMFGTL
jgi:DNA mismatch endonuclease (patch repair protein)